MNDRESAARRSSTTLHPNLQFYDTQLLEKMNEKNEEIDDDVFSAEGSVSSFCSDSSSDESNDSTGDDSDDSNEDDNSEHNGPHGRMGNGTPTPPQIKPWSAVSKVKSTPCAKKEYTFQELFGFGRMRAAYVDFRVCPSHVLYFLPVEGWC